MSTHTIIFRIAVIAVAWLGFRNLISIAIGHSQIESLKIEQRLCHVTSFTLHCEACFFVSLPFVMKIDQRRNSTAISQKRCH